MRQNIEFLYLYLIQTYIYQVQTARAKSH
jgi:hypothetical protein